MKKSVKVVESIESSDEFDSSQAGSEEEEQARLLSIGKKNKKGNSGKGEPSQYASRL